MNLPEQIAEDLARHLEITQELLRLAEREGQALRRTDNPSLFEFYQEKKNLLPRFSKSLETLRERRTQWQRLPQDERRQRPEITALLRRSQDVTMKVICLDRENEQGLLRRGLVPARELPSINRQRPHFVADLYRRNGGR